MIDNTLLTPLNNTCGGKFVAFVRSEGSLDTAAPRCATSAPASAGSSTAA
jgi:hypothetical protein